MEIPNVIALENPTTDHYMCKACQNPVALLEDELGIGIVQHSRSGMYGWVFEKAMNVRRDRDELSYKVGDETLCDTYCLCGELLGFTYIEFGPEEYLLKRDQVALYLGRLLRKEGESTEDPLLNLIENSEFFERDEYEEEEVDEPDEDEGLWDLAEPPENGEWWEPVQTAGDEGLWEPADPPLNAGLATGPAQNGGFFNGEWLELGVLELATNGGHEPAANGELAGGPAANGGHEPAVNGGLAGGPAANGGQEPDGNGGLASGRAANGGHEQAVNGGLRGNHLESGNRRWTG